MKNIFLLLFLLPVLATAQSDGKKALTHEDLVTWQRIKSYNLSDDGQYVLYVVKGEETDATLHIFDTETNRKNSFPRGTKPRLSPDGKFAVFMIEPFRDSLIAQKRREVKKEDLTKDTLAIYELAARNLTKIPNVKSFKLSEKNSPYLTYLREPEKEEKKAEPAEDNGVGLVTPEPIKMKKESKKNGSKLTWRNLNTGREEFFRYVTDYEIAEEGARLLYHTTSDDSTYLAGLYLFDFGEGKNYEVMTDSVYKKYHKLTLSPDGSRAAFAAEKDTTDSRIHEIALYEFTGGVTEFVADNKSDFLPANHRVSEHYDLQYSEDNRHLFFGIAEQLPLKDTLLADEEKPKVEVWSTRDTRLYPQQKVELKDDLKKAFTVAYTAGEDKFTVFGDAQMPEIRFNHDRTAPYALGYDDTPFLRQTSWEGWPPHRDVYKVNTASGQRTKIADELRALPRLSPAGKFIVWYNLIDSAWYAHDNTANVTNRLTDNDLGVFYDELNDRPMYPWDYGRTGWTEEDAAFFFYDRYDIWRVNPAGKNRPVRLTKGREEKRRYRYVKTDPDQHSFAPEEEVLLHVFDEKTKGSGYVKLHVATGKVTKLLFADNLNYTRSVRKAKDADVYLFVRENYQTFPNLHLTDGRFKKPRQITDINPQQSEYAWGTSEIYTWTAFDGQKIEGLLVKPADFDPNKKYPMIVNFYERSSDRLHRYPHPHPGRSTINYAFYPSKGYLIFNPDVPYKVGYPGESAYNSVVSGVQALIKEGFVAEDRIGAQGHSWGGYQVAHLATKTDIFACIESGAPVVNMTSAYGGIRWGSGRSRMFQYEHTQSRIGASLWENPDLYLENSPLFNTDKINTPILILHNDKDGAVPWYQGIEWFVALRRLGKDAWLLNYNDEPHWPLKLPNRKDFNVRMQQFFDHYLMGAEMPVWMRDGVPAILGEE